MDEPSRAGAAPSVSWAAHASWVWALVLPVLLLGPALGPGYVLRADMVWVPDLHLGSQAWGLAASLPRAVPSDAVVGVIDELVPGGLLQVLVLYGSLAAAGLGIRALVPATAPVGRLVAVSAYVWAPFVAERLLMGHWPVLVGYAVLPWVIRLGRARGSGAVAGYALVLPLGSLSAGAGLVTALTALATGRRDRSVRQRAWLVAGAAAANAPWVATGLLHLGEARSSADGATAFAPRSWAGLPLAVQALDLGVVWNTDAVLDSRRGMLAAVSVLLVVGLALVGRRTWAAWLGPQAGPVGGLALAGLAWVLFSGYVPGAVGWLVEHVPGAGVLRDGSRVAALTAPAVALLVAAGAQRVARWGPTALARGALAAALALAPLALVPDLAWGASGRLAAVDYPDGWAQARDALATARADGAEGDVLLMPFSSYRAPDFNGGRKVLDPAGRYLGVDYVTNDALLVAGREVAGEDPRAADALAALALPDPAARADRLRELGIGFVARSTGDDVARISGPKAAEVAGTRLWPAAAGEDVGVEGADLEVLRLDGPVTPWEGFSAARRAVALVAWLAYAGCFAVALLAGMNWVATSSRKSSA